MSRELWVSIEGKDEKEHKLEFDADGNMFIDEKQLQFHKKVELRWFELLLLTITTVSVAAQALHAWLPCFSK
jgi:hypothetical protein